MSAALSMAESSAGFQLRRYRIDENRGQPAIVLGVALPLEDLHALDVGEELDCSPRATAGGARASPPAAPTARGQARPETLLNR